jgi:hypothetical protein
MQESTTPMCVISMRFGGSVELIPYRAHAACCAISNKVFNLWGEKKILFRAAQSNSVARITWNCEALKYA